MRQGSAMVPTSLTRNLIGPVRQSLQTLELSVRHGCSGSIPPRPGDSFIWACAMCSRPPSCRR